MSYPQMPPSRDPYGNAVAGQQGNGLAIAALVCGIVGIFVANFILGPLAIVFGGIGLNRANAGAKYRGQAVAGIVLGILAIAVFAILLAVRGFTY